MLVSARRSILANLGDLGSTSGAAKAKKRASTGVISKKDLAKANYVVPAPQPQWRGGPTDAAGRVTSPTVRSRPNGAPPSKPSETTIAAAHKVMAEKGITETSAPWAGEQNPLYTMPPDPMKAAADATAAANKAYNEALGDDVGFWEGLPLPLKLGAGAAGALALFLIARSFSKGSGQSGAPKSES